jgi:TetR/AcrR family transcriptional repressor of uid operon
MRKIDPVKHEEKRQEILEAAGRCFARKGFQGATISDICAEANKAGVCRGVF